MGQIYYEIGQTSCGDSRLPKGTSDWTITEQSKKEMTRISDAVEYFRSGRFYLECTWESCDGV